MRQSDTSGRNQVSNGLLPTRCVVRMAALLAALSVCAAAYAVDPAPPASAPARVTQPAAAGDSNPATPLTVTDAIAQLAAIKYTQRDRAEHFLKQQPAETLPDIETALRATGDSEVAIRLTRVAVHLFLKARTPFEGSASLLGIGLSIETVHIGPHDDDVRLAIAVAELQPGFPAAEVLRPGDRIIALNGEPFPLDTSIESFRRSVNTTPPGTTLRLTILRGKERQDVSVRLAGVPEEGPNAIAIFVRDRQAAANAYLRQLHLEHEIPLTIQGMDDTGGTGGNENKL